MTAKPTLTLVLSVRGQPGYYWSLNRYNLKSTFSPGFLKESTLKVINNLMFWEELVPTSISTYPGFISIELRFTGHCDTRLRINRWQRQQAEQAAIEQAPSYQPPAAWLEAAYEDRTDAGLGEG